MVEPIAHLLDADVRVPGSKSITNRALLCASLATGTSVLRGVLLADDTLAMIDGLRALGTEIDVIEGPRPVATVVGVGGSPRARPPCTPHCRERHLDSSFPLRRWRRGR